LGLAIVSAPIRLGAIKIGWGATIRTEAEPIIFGETILGAGLVATAGGAQAIWGRGSTLSRDRSPLAGHACPDLVATAASTPVAKAPQINEETAARNSSTATESDRSARAGRRGWLFM